MLGTVLSMDQSPARQERLSGRLTTGGILTRAWSCARQRFRHRVPDMHQVYPAKGSLLRRCSFGRIGQLAFFVFHTHAGLQASPRGWPAILNDLGGSL